MKHFNGFPLSLEWNCNSQVWPIRPREVWPPTASRTCQPSLPLTYQAPSYGVYFFTSELFRLLWLNPFSLCSWRVGSLLNVGLSFYVTSSEKSSLTFTKRNPLLFFFHMHYVVYLVLTSSLVQSFSWLQSLVYLFSYNLLSQWPLSDTKQRSWQSCSSSHQHSAWYRVYTPWNVYWMNG